MANLIDFIARLLISALFLISAYNKIFSIDGTMSWMEGFGIPGLLLYPTIALEIILPFVYNYWIPSKIISRTTCYFLYNDCIYFSL